MRKLVSKHDRKKKEREALIAVVSFKKNYAFDPLFNKMFIYFIQMKYKFTPTDFVFF